MPIPIIPAGFAAATGGGGALSAAIPSIISGAAKFIGGLFGKDAQEDAADKQADLQRQFAQNAIQWKVEDAKKAGIHPLYALGAQTVSYQPNLVGGDLGSTFSDMGQDLSRAVEAVQTAPERVMNKTIAALQIERAGLENDLLRSQIARTINGTPAAPGGYLGPYGGNTMTMQLPAGPGASVPMVTGPSSSAQVAQDQYGDIVENVYGVWRLANDAVHNLQMKYPEFFSAARMGPFPYLSDVAPGTYTRRVGPQR